MMLFILILGKSLIMPTLDKVDEGKALFQNLWEDLDIW